MSYGIESPLPIAPSEWVTIDVAAGRCHLLPEKLEEYVHEGLVVPFKSSNGVVYFTDLDYSWINTIKRLREEAHLSFDGIRGLLLARCGCWKFRHCEFHNTRDCPLTKDPSKPCWANRAEWHVLAAYPCYSCLVYRTLPLCGSVKAVLHGSPCGAQPTDGDRGH